jgi:undecaprenyl-diphosphatase
MRGRSIRLLSVLLLLIVFGVTFGSIASSIGNQPMGPFDTPIIEVVQGWETSGLTAVMKIFTWVGTGYGVTPIAMLMFTFLYFGLRHRQQAWLLIGTVAGSIILNSVLKHVFKRERPEIYRIANASGFSFPSGHAMMALTLYGIIAFIFWHHVKRTGNRILLVLFAAFMILMIGTSRIYLGVHYPSDIVGGYAASGFWVIIAIVIYNYFQNKREKGKDRSTSH